LAEINWRKEFPTYDYDAEKGRDIILEEYKASSKVLEAEERVFASATSIAAVLGALFVSLAVGALSKIAEDLSGDFRSPGYYLFFFLILFACSIVILKTFADRRVSIVYSERKIVVLRRMLGVDYGGISLILPRGRLEGEGEPMRIRFFSGWMSVSTFPCLIISGASSVFFFYGLVQASNVTALSEGVALWQAPWVPVLFSMVYFVLLCIVFRYFLLERHESLMLAGIRFAARIVGLKLVDSFEQVIYLAKLAVVETARLKVDSKEFKRILVFVEDKQFFSHPGVSRQGLCRALLSNIGLGRRTGGSTITQQLVRSLFVVDQAARLRKIFEIALALSFDLIVDKSEQLDFYVSSVRYDYGVFGLIEAQKKFFGSIVKDMSPAQSFFLVERISNIRGLILTDKIAYTVGRACAARMLSREDVLELCDIYMRASSQGLIGAVDAAFQAKLLAVTDPTYESRGGISYYIDIIKRSLRSRIG